MARKVLTIIKLQIPGGQANPAPPVGPALGQHGVNIMEFCKAFNAQTADQNGRITPVEITVFEDRSFTFITKTPPAAVLIKEALEPREGLGRAEPSEGREALAGAAAPDRRDEARRPEREGRRPGDAGHRRDCAVDGSGGGRPDGSATASATEARGARSIASAPTTPLEAIRLLKGARGGEVRRDGRDALQSRASTSGTPTSSCAAR